MPSREQVTPNREQLLYLQSLRRRCEEEAADLTQWNLATAERPTLSEPLRLGCFGIPGAGKSQCLKWTRRFFAECMGWEHGTMASTARQCDDWYYGFAASCQRDADAFHEH